jgi:uncharacterized membrane protein
VLAYPCTDDLALIFEPNATHQQVASIKPQHSMQFCNMSVTNIQSVQAVTASIDTLRFGVDLRPEQQAMQWRLKRTCSVTPRQMLIFYVSLSLLSLGIGGVFWWQGATLIMPFASLEVVALGVALLIYSRHATDGEHIQLQAGQLVVEQNLGGRIQRTEFVSIWVCVKPEKGNDSLIELSGQGKQIVVGRFIRPELRRQFADELHWALRRSSSMTVDNMQKNI